MGIGAVFENATQKKERRIIFAVSRAIVGHFNITKKNLIVDRHPPVHHIGHHQINRWNGRKPSNSKVPELWSITQHPNNYVEIQYLNYKRATTKIHKRSGIMYHSAAVQATAITAVISRPVEKKKCNFQATASKEQENQRKEPDKNRQQHRRKWCACEVLSTIRLI